MWWEEENDNLLFPLILGVDLYVLERALLSTHPNSEWMLEQILENYKKALLKTKGKGETTEILRKFEDIRMRGRKRTMVG